MFQPQYPYRDQEYVALGRIQEATGVGISRAHLELAFLARMTYVAQGQLAF